MGKGLVGGCRDSYGVTQTRPCEDLVTYWLPEAGCGIARRPMPRLGETPQEQEERRREGLAWELETGAVHAVVQAYRQARDRGESDLTAFNAAADAALALGRPPDKINDTARAC